MKPLYDTYCEDLQRAGVYLSAQKEWDDAELVFKRATDILKGTADFVIGQERFKAQAHLGRIARDRALNFMRYSAWSWQSPNSRNGALADAHEQAATSLIYLRHASENNTFARTYSTHLHSEVGASYTAAARHAGLRLLEAKHLDDDDAQRYWRKEMDTHFRSSTSELAKGDNYFYAINGKMVEAFYSRVLLQINPTGLVWKALLQLASTRNGSHRLAAFGSFIKRLPEVYHGESDQLLAHI